MDRVGLQDPVDPETLEDLDLPVRHQVLNGHVWLTSSRVFGRLSRTGTFGPGRPVRPGSPCYI